MYLLSTAKFLGARPGRFIYLVFNVFIPDRKISGARVLAASVYELGSDASFYILNI